MLAYPFTLDFKLLDANSMSFFFLHSKIISHIDMHKSFEGRIKMKKMNE